jgi:hypothetical protein
VQKIANIYKKKFIFSLKVVMGKTFPSLPTSKFKSMSYSWSGLKNGTQYAKFASFLHFSICLAFNISKAIFIT